MWGWQWDLVSPCCCSLSLSLLLLLLLIAIKGSLTATTITTTTMLARDDVVCCWTAPLRSPFSTICAQLAMMSVSGQRAGAVPLGNVGQSDPSAPRVNVNVNVGLEGVSICAILLQSPRSSALREAVPSCLCLPLPAALLRCTFVTASLPSEGHAPTLLSSYLACLIDADQGY